MEKCKNCKHFHLLKELTENGWKISSVCTVWVDTGNDKYDDFCIVITENDMCEMHEERK